MCVLVKRRAISDRAQNLAQRQSGCVGLVYDVSNLFAESKIIMNHGRRWVGTKGAIPGGERPGLVDAICKFDSASSGLMITDCVCSCFHALFLEPGNALQEKSAVVQTFALANLRAVLASGTTIGERECVRQC